MRIQLSDNFILSLGDDFDEYEQKIIYLESIKDSKLNFDKYLLETPNQLIYKGLDVSSVYLWFNTDILCSISLTFIDEVDMSIFKKLNNLFPEQKTIISNDCLIWVYVQQKNSRCTGITFSQFEHNKSTQSVTNS